MLGSNRSDIEIFDFDGDLSTHGGISRSRKSVRGGRCRRGVSAAWMPRPSPHGRVHGVPALRHRPANPRNASCCCCRPAAGTTRVQGAALPNTPTSADYPCCHAGCSRLAPALHRHAPAGTPRTGEPRDGRRRANGIGASHSSQCSRPGPSRSWRRARAIASSTVASIWSWTAPSPAQPVAMAILRRCVARYGDDTPRQKEGLHVEPSHARLRFRMPNRTRTDPIRPIAT